jgi:hypothetical protein
MGNLPRKYHSCQHVYHPITAVAIHRSEAIYERYAICDWELVGKQQLGKEGRSEDIQELYKRNKLTVVLLVGRRGEVYYRIGTGLIHNASWGAVHHCY